MALATITGFTADSVLRGNNKKVLYTAPLRAATATTTSYVASDHVYCGIGQKLSLEFALVWVDSTSTEWYLEWSSDGTNWYRELNLSPSSGTSTAYANNQTIANSASAKWIHSQDVVDAFVRVGVKKTGGVGADTLAVTAVVLGA